VRLISTSTVNLRNGKLSTTGNLTIRGRTVNLTSFTLEGKTVLVEAADALSAFGSTLIADAMSISAAEGTITLADSSLTAKTLAATGKQGISATNTTINVDTDLALSTAADAAVDLAKVTLNVGGNLSLTSPTNLDLSGLVAKAGGALVIASRDDLTLSESTLSAADINISTVEGSIALDHNTFAAKTLTITGNHEISAANAEMTTTVPGEARMSAPQLNLAGARLNLAGSISLEAVEFADLTQADLKAKGEVLVDALKTNLGQARLAGASIRLTGNTMNVAKADLNAESNIDLTTQADLDISELVAKAGSTITMTARNNLTASGSTRLTAHSYDTGSIKLQALEGALVLEGAIVESSGDLSLSAPTETTLRRSVARANKDLRILVTDAGGRVSIIDDSQVTGGLFPIFLGADDEAVDVTLTVSGGGILGGRYEKEIFLTGALVDISGVSLPSKLYTIRPGADDKLILRLGDGISGEHSYRVSKAVLALPDGRSISGESVLDLGSNTERIFWDITGQETGTVRINGGWGPQVTFSFLTRLIGGSGDDTLRLHNGGMLEEMDLGSGDNSVPATGSDTTWWIRADDKGTYLTMQSVNGKIDRLRNVSHIAGNGGFAGMSANGPAGDMALTRSDGTPYEDYQGNHFMVPAMNVTDESGNPLLDNNGEAVRVPAIFDYAYFDLETGRLVENWIMAMPMLSAPDTLLVNPMLPKPMQKPTLVPAEIVRDGEGNLILDAQGRPQLYTTFDMDGNGYLSPAEITAAYDAGYGREGHDKLYYEGGEPARWLIDEYNSGSVAGFSFSGIAATVDSVSGGTYEVLAGGHMNSITISAAPYTLITHSDTAYRELNTAEGVSEEQAQRHPSLSFAVDLYEKGLSGDDYQTPGTDPGNGAVAVLDTDALLAAGWTVLSGRGGRFGDIELGTSVAVVRNDEGRWAVVLERPMLHHSGDTVTVDAGQSPIYLLARDPDGKPWEIPIGITLHDDGVVTSLSMQEEDGVNDRNITAGTTATGKFTWSGADWSDSLTVSFGTTTVNVTEKDQKVYDGPAGALSVSRYDDNWRWDGSWRFVSNPDAATTRLSFTFGASDMDGDVSTQDLTFTVVKAG
jgi:hypothetical protein